MLCGSMEFESGERMGFVWSEWDRAGNQRRDVLPRRSQVADRRYCWVHQR